MLEVNSALAAPLNLRKPERTFLVMLTPALTQPGRAGDAISKSRLYGWLMLLPASGNLISSSRAQTNALDLAFDPGSAVRGPLLAVAVSGTDNQDQDLTVPKLSYPTENAGYFTVQYDYQETKPLPLSASGLAGSPGTARGRLKSEGATSFGASA